MKNSERFEKNPLKKEILHGEDTGHDIIYLNEQRICIKLRYIKDKSNWLILL